MTPICSPVAPADAASTFVESMLERVIEEATRGRRDGGPYGSSPIGDGGPGPEAMTFRRDPRPTSGRSALTTAIFPRNPMSRSSRHADRIRATATGTTRSRKWRRRLTAVGRDARQPEPPRPSPLATIERPVGPLDSSMREPRRPRLGASRGRDPRGRQRRRRLGRPESSLDRISRDPQGPAVRRSDWTRRWSSAPCRPSRSPTTSEGDGHIGDRLASREA